MEVLVAMAWDGLTTDRELADHLDLSVNTVRTHVNVMMNKTQRHTRAAMVSAFWRWVAERVGPG